MSYGVKLSSLNPTFDARERLHRDQDGDRLRRNLLTCHRAIDGRAVNWLVIGERPPVGGLAVGRGAVFARLGTAALLPFRLAGRVPHGDRLAGNREGGSDRGRFNETHGINVLWRATSLSCAASSVPLAPQIPGSRNASWRRDFGRRFSLAVAG